MTQKEEIKRATYDNVANESLNDFRKLLNTGRTEI